MEGLGEPTWQPITMLATIAALIDGGLADGRRQYETLVQARPKPYVLDDDTITRTRRVYREGLDWCDLYGEQLTRWRTSTLTAGQHAEVTRLDGTLGELRTVFTGIVDLVDELAHATIERQLAKSDLEVGVEHLLRSRPQ